MYKSMRGVTALLAVLVSSAAVADLNSRLTFSIPAQTVSAALFSFADQAGIQVMMATADLADIRSQGVSGERTAEEALNAILQGTGLKFRAMSGNAVTIEGEAREKHTAGVGAASGAATPADMTVAQADTGNSQTGKSANETDDETSQGIQEIIVSAQRREQNLQEVPISIAVLNEEGLESRGVRNLHDLSFAVPGMYVQENGGQERRVTIRGIGNFFGSSSTVGAYVDEAVANGTPGYGQLDLQTFDLARVEVLRGPQGTLYGQASMGGTVRYITADPELDRVMGGTDAGFSFTQDGGSAQRYRGMANVPLVDGKLGVRIAGTYEDVGGWIDQPALAKENINGHQLFNVRTKVLWSPTESFDLRGMVIVHRNDVEGLSIGSDENGDYQQRLLDPSTPSAHVDYDLFNVTMSYDLSGVRLLSTSTYLDVDTGYRHLARECCTPTPSVNGQFVIDRYTDTGRAFTQELRLSSVDSGALEWTVGGYYQRARYHNDWADPTRNFFGVPGGTLGVDLFNLGNDADTESKSWAAFGDVSYALTERLKLGAGLRYFEDDANLLTRPGDVFQERTFTSTNPKVVVSYAMSSEVDLYASAAKGFRSGGFNAAGQPPYDPEELWSYEIGAKMSLLEGSLHAELAFSHSDYQGYQIVGFVPGYLGNITSNAGEARIDAVDGLLAFQATKQWELGISGSFVDSEFTRTNDVSSAYRVGDSLDLVPEYGVAAWTEYRFSWSGDGNTSGFVRLDYNRQGIAHARNRSFGPDYHSTSDVIGLMNARLGWARGRWTAEIYGRNLLDESGFDSPGSIERNATRPWPRTFGVQAGFHFD